jgi:hypothetical protein
MGRKRTKDRTVKAVFSTTADIIDELRNNLNETDKFVIDAAVRLFASAPADTQAQMLVEARLQNRRVPSAPTA